VPEECGQEELVGVGKHLSSLVVVHDSIGSRKIGRAINYIPIALLAKRDAIVR
jgi:hypothetical protein